MHTAQSAYRNSQSLYRGYVGGRGAGKTWIGAYDLMVRAKPKRTYLVGSPTYTILDDTTFPTFRDIAQEIGLWVKVKLTPRPNVHLSNGAIVRFRSLEDPESARGPNLSGAWLDEASCMPYDAFKIVIASLREKGEMGWLGATFTPKGLAHWTYEQFGTAKANTEIFHSSTRDNPFIHANLAATLAQTYSGAFAEQELEGKFVDEDESFAVLPATWVHAAMERWKEGPPPETPLSALGVDVAYGGADRTVIARRHRHWFARLLKYAGSQTPSGAASAYLVRQAMGQEPTALINVDGIGYGAACCESLSQMRLQVMPVNFGAGCDCRDRTGLFTFLNIRAFAYWSLREALDPTSGMNIALPPDRELEAELTAARWTAVGGVVRIEPKDKIKERIGRSPDCADAVALAVLLPGFGGESLGPIQLSS